MGGQSNIRRCFCFADVQIGITSEQPFRVSEMLERFSAPWVSPQLEFLFRWTTRPVQHDVLRCLSEDMFHRFCTDGICTQVEMKGAKGVPSAVLFCDHERKTMPYEIYFPNGRQLPDLTVWLSLLPMPWLLCSHKVLFLHASRVSLGDGAIVFVGPSGAGKTTLAALWKHSGSGEVVGNDRVLLRQVEGQWQSYGYFEDGDTPVCDPRRLPLRAIVFLSKDIENRVSRLKPLRSVTLTMSQIVAEPWDGHMKQTVLEEVLALTQAIPVYHLQCRADIGAVQCLKSRLEEDGVMQWA